MFGVAPFFDLTFLPLVGSENKQTFGLRVSFLNTFYIFKKIVPCVTV